LFIEKSRKKIRKIKIKMSLNVSFDIMDENLQIYTLGWFKQIVKDKSLNENVYYQIRDDFLKTKEKTKVENKTVKFEIRNQIIVY
jgi:hypothetical protein